MNNETMNHFVSNVQLPSDFLLDNYKSITRRSDVDEMFEGLDSLFEDVIAETWEKAFQAGYDLYHKQLEKNPATPTVPTTPTKT